MAHKVLLYNSSLVGDNPDREARVREVEQVNDRLPVLTTAPNKNLQKLKDLVNTAEDILCLICGHDLNGCEDGEGFDDPVVVKEEVDISDFTADEEGDLDDPSKNTSDNRDVDVQQCPSNGNNINIAGSLTNRPNRTNLRPGKWTEEEKILYRNFLGWFKIHLSAKGKRKNVVNYGWNGSSGKDIFPFCEVCKGQLMALLKFQRSLQQLELQIKNGIDDLKHKINSCEKIFGKKGIYEKDNRYRRARRQVVKDFNKLNPNKPVPETVFRTGTRISGRKRKATARFAASDNSTSTGLPGPIVLLSSSDKTSADDHMLSLKDIKPEISDTPEADAEEILDMTINDGVGTLMELNSKKDSTSGVTKKRSSRRRRKRVLDIDPESPPVSHFDDPHDDMEEEIENKNAKHKKEDDDDYRPDDKRPKRSPRKRKPVKTPEERDQDWVMDEDDDNAIDQEVEEEDDEDFSDHDEEGKYGRCKVDKEKRTLTYKSLIFNHLEPYTGNMYQCSKCNAEISFTSSSRIRSHFVRFHTNKFSCKLCEHRSDSASNLRNHIRVAHEGQKWRSEAKAECRICGKPVSRSHIKFHEWTHKNEEERRTAIARGDPDVPSIVVKDKKYQCDECGSKFSGPSDLKRHQIVIHGSEEMKDSIKQLCPECGGKFIELRQHRKVVHGVDGRIYTCLENGCGRVCKTLPQLAKHKNAVHRKIRPHKCSLCPREFSSHQSLQNHLNLHNGIRPFSCQHCPSAFATKSMVKRHTEIYHTEGRPPPKRKPFSRGPTMLGSDVRKQDLQNRGQYLPPSALATWAAGREPTSHFPVGTNPAANVQMDDNTPDPPI